MRKYDEPKPARIRKPTEKKRQDPQARARQREWVQYGRLRNNVLAK